MTDFGFHTYTTGGCQAVLSKELRKAAWRKKVTAANAIPAEETTPEYDGNSAINSTRATAQPL
jgi:hypothetical protein